MRSSGRWQILTLAYNDPALQALQRIRDEAHRFALSYHQKLRSDTGGFGSLHNKSRK